MEKEVGAHQEGSALIRDIILGGQDGLVNILGLVLAVAGATESSYVVLISGLAGTFAESISMAAVAYTSSKAAKEYYQRQLELEWQEVKEKPAEEVQEIKEIYGKKGFKGTMLNKIVQQITKNKQVWVETMMQEELRLNPEEFAHPVRDAVVVGIASLIGSLIPLLPFFFVPVFPAVWQTLIICTVALFMTGAIKAQVTVGAPWKSGVEMALVGITAAILGWVVGLGLGALPIK